MCRNSLNYATRQRVKKFFLFKGKMISLQFKEVLCLYVHGKKLEKRIVPSEK